jgi:hypothetical protein
MASCTSQQSVSNSKAAPKWAMARSLAAAGMAATDEVMVFSFQ